MQLYNNFLKFRVPNFHNPKGYYLCDTQCQDGPEILQEGTVA